jgi:5,10-methenyltetrahydromethanopterin hydrogenase
MNLPPEEIVANIRATLARVLNDLPTLPAEEALSLIHAECKWIVNYLDDREEGL